MFDIWIGDMNLTVLILVFSFVVVLPVQLLLCFKVKSRTLRCLPMAMFLLLAVAAFILNGATPGWDGMGYLFGAIYAGIMLFLCGVGWCVWALVGGLKKKR